MRKLLPNLSYGGPAGKLLGVVCVLMGALSGRGQRQEELWIKLHVVWTTEYKMNYSQGNNAGQMSDNVRIIYDGLLHAQAPEGSEPWDMNTGEMDEHLTVSGGGSGTVTGKDHNGVENTYRQSWSWVLKDAPKALGGGVSMAPDGNFQVNLPSLNGVKTEPQIERGDRPGNLQGAMNSTFGAAMLSPRTATGMTYPSRGPGFPDSDPNFWSQFSGKFDPKDRNFMKSGSGTTSRQDRSTGSIQGLDSTMTYSVEATYSFNFNQQPEEVEAVLIPEDGYDQWMPQAGDNEDAPGDDPLVVRVVLQKKGQEGQKPKATAHFKFELVGTSQEPGVCLNWPAKNKAKSDFDLKIDQDQGVNAQLQVKDSKGQSASSESGLQESAVTVVSHDWGAWGNLKVTAILDQDPHTEIVAHLKGRPGIDALSIPRDDNGNRVADAWEEVIAPLSAANDSDDDSYPKGNGDAGDALSLYEEYRGFVINGQHFRTDPNYKDVFVFDMDQMTTGSFAASGLDIHLVRGIETNYNYSAVNHFTINFNHGLAHLGDKYVLFLWDNPRLPETGFMGRADCGPTPAKGGYGLPKTCWSIQVARDALYDPTDPSQAVLTWVLGHELSHGVNVAHHGQSDYVRKNIVDSKSGTRYQSPDGSPGPWGVTAPGGQESGVQECIMRYPGKKFYEFPGGKWTWQHASQNVSGYEYEPDEPVGTIFCDTDKGTGVNDSNGGTLPDGRKLPKAGNASVGDCTHQFSVNDLK